jgi:hypothetical protein
MSVLRPVFLVVLSLLLVVSPLCLAHQHSHGLRFTAGAAASARPARRLLVTAAAGESSLAAHEPCL